MIADNLRENLRATPFAPFTIHLSDGRALTVKHHDFAMLSPSGLTFHVYTDVNRYHLVNVPQITSVASKDQSLKKSRRTRRR